MKLNFRAGTLFAGSIVVLTLSAMSCAMAFGEGAALGQEPASWREPLTFHTFSIAAIDPETGEVGVAVTTRATCVGNGVPWVRVGVGAVATQAETKTEYGPLLLDRIQAGESPSAALEEALRKDPARERRQVGVISLDGRSAQFTGGLTPSWSGQRHGTTYVVQGNTVAGPEVLNAVATSFESSAGTDRHLADRLITAISAGSAAGGDIRRGRMQSAAVIVADPRPGHARRPDKVSTFINVCEHQEPVAEMRRIYDSISETLGYRVLQLFEGRDVRQLAIILTALGYLPERTEENAPEKVSQVYSPALIAAVDAFRRDENLTGDEAPPGYVDKATVDRMWAALARKGKLDIVRKRLTEATQITR